MKRVYDLYRNIIQEGDYINYPVRKTSETYMRTAKVLAVRERENPTTKKNELVLDVMVAIPPRGPERRQDPKWRTTMRRVTVSCTTRTTVLPKSLVQNDRRYRCLLDV